MNRATGKRIFAGVMICALMLMQVAPALANTDYTGNHYIMLTALGATGSPGYTESVDSEYSGVAFDNGCGYITAFGALAGRPSQSLPSSGKKFTRDNLWYATAYGALSTLSGNYTTAIGYNSWAGADIATALGYNSQARGYGAVALGNSAAKADGATAIGLSAQAQNTEAVALGCYSGAAGYGATALGTRSQATGYAAVAIGQSTSATASGSVAIAPRAHATGDNSIAMGVDAYTGAGNAVAFGSRANASYDNSVALGSDSVTNGANEVSVGNSTTQRKITNVAAGTISHTSTDAVNASQLQDTKVSSTSWTEKTIGGVTHKFLNLNLENSYYPGEITETKAIDVTDLINTHVEIVGSLGNISTSNGIVSTKKEYYVDGVKHVDVDFKMGDNFRLTDAYTGNYTDYTTNGISINGKTYVSDGGLNANNQKITNVADGTIAPDSKDAVNGSQMYEMYRLIKGTGAVELDLFRNQIAQTSKELQEVGAMSAALAGLHYMEPSGEGDDKVTGAVSYGGYRSENAVAVGLAYKPNQNMMFSASTSIGSNQNAYNAGVAFKFGPGKTVNRAEMAKQIKYLSEKNAKLEQEVQELKELVKKVMEKQN